MKNTRHAFVQQRVQQHRRNTSSGTFEDTEFKETPQMKEFNKMLERMKQESLETGNRWEGPH
jgi:hypothetical protein